MTEFTTQDIKQINAHGLTLDEVHKQLHDFETGFPYADIVAPATVGDGIEKLDSAAREKYAKLYREYTTGNAHIVKFVPASGAATRMFKDLFNFITTHEKNEITARVLDNLDQFAFYDDLRQYIPENATDTDIISCIITNAGLNYGQLPKALIAFHKYDNMARTALEEHLTEAAQYASCNNCANIHFTVSPEHRHGFDALLARVIPEYQTKYGIQYNIGMSEQKCTTDTIAVNPDNTPFRDGNGNLLFRPAGHGALIENLNDINADIVFIKNIDNVCHGMHRNDTIEYKSVLAGVLISRMQRTHQYMRELARADENKLNEIKIFIERDLGVKIGNKKMSRPDYANILNRPMRVCGMVKNIGAPGGGPFWVRDADGRITLQIVESAQISPDDRDIMNMSSHFNPVDLVCCTRDYDGKKFDLSQFVDPRTGFISEKSFGGATLRAMERPGLWNGAMANWTTIFIEVPITTFTPVKTVADLLAPAHRAS